MKRILKERDRLLAAAARAMGLISAVFALASLCLPGAVPGTLPLVIAVVCTVVIAGSFLRLPTGAPLWRIAGIDLLVLAVIADIVFSQPRLNPATTSALALLVGGCVAATSIVLITSLPRMLVLLSSLVASMAALAAAFGTSHPMHGLQAALLALIGWVFAIVLALWLGRVVPQTVVRIANMTDAYRAERLASQTEAQRRQGARLLHDTVLATLTLLAHSGVGVSERALREQATEDAALLRQLRMGFSPNPVASGDYKLTPVAESTLGNTLESVKQRFQRMGLDVNWHGTGQVLLPSDVLDAFLLALQECLENVRRHSGADEAHVTITDDDVTVRAMVTDSGKGFRLDQIPAGRLGFTESVVARLRDVGGNARVFSAPGSGTTVVLEVPK